MNGIFLGMMKQNIRISEVKLKLEKQVIFMDSEMSVLVRLTILQSGEEE